MNTINITHIHQFINSITPVKDIEKISHLKEKQKKLIYLCLRALTHDKILSTLKTLYPYNKFCHHTSKILYTLYQRTLKPEKKFSFMDRALINELSFAKNIDSSFEENIIRNTNFSIEGLSIVKVPFFDELITNPLTNFSFVPMWGTTFFQSKHFKNLTFKDCVFDFIDFQNSSFTHCHFKRCSFKGTTFLNNQFSEVLFNHCRFEDNFFDDSRFDRVSFKRSHLEMVSFQKITYGQLEFTHNPTQILFGVNPGSAAPLNVLIPWNPIKPGLSCTTLNEVLKKTGIVPFKFNYLTGDICVNQLQQEVSSLIKFAPDHGSQSIPQFILHQAHHHPKIYPEIHKIQIYTRHLFINSSTLGIILAGGADIEPEFYGQSRSALTSTETDYRRSLFEFCLIETALANHLPILGLCRGSQIGNVYFGGTLLQHINGHKNVLQRYTFKNDSLVKQLLKKNKVKGVSLHHQAHETIGKGLKVVSSFRGIPKVLEGSDPQNPIILLQFHAEFTKKTLRIFQRFFSAEKSVQQG